MGKGYVRWTGKTPADAPRRGPLRCFSVTPEGLEALRTSRRAFRALSRGLNGLLESP